MRKRSLLNSIFVFLCATILLSYTASAEAGSSKTKRTIDPVVSTEWLAANSGSPNLAIIDVRSDQEY